MTTAHLPKAFTDLGQAVEQFQALQRPDGSVHSAHFKVAEALLDQVLAAAAPLWSGEHPTLREAVELDFEQWRRSGLDTPPHFDRSRDAIPAPREGETLFILLPLKTANGPPPQGCFLEFFAAQRFEAPEVAAVSQRFAHPRAVCQSMQLLAASRGYAQGNCIVFFPENIVAAAPPATQGFAMFFFDKFHRIYHQQTLVLARRVFGTQHAVFGPHWLSARLDPDACFRARCIWGYLHDYFHHRGARPLDRHLTLKCNWHAGVLEELKVDVQTALAALGPHVPMGSAIVEFILTERMLRYPAQHDACRNFDAASGVLMFEHLRREGALVEGAGPGWRLALPRLAPALQSLVESIEAIERNAIDAPDYKAAAARLVHHYLPPGHGTNRFEFTAGHPLARALEPA